MDHFYQRRVKEEFDSTSPSPSPSPAPMECLKDSGPPPFLTKTYDIVEDSKTNHIISWTTSNNSFVVWDPHSFCITLLPRYFKHNNFSSFVRQLNTYGFRKVDPDRWEFANEGFLRGQRHLLKNIKRRYTLHQPHSSSQQQSFNAFVEIGRYGLDDHEVDRLRRDKQVLMVELVKLREEQQKTRAHIQEIKQRLKKTELKQQQMMRFLARAMQNPSFLQQLIMLQKGTRNKEVEEEAMISKRRKIGPNNEFGLIEYGIGEIFVKDVEEPHRGYNVDDVVEFEVLENDLLALRGEEDGRNKYVDEGFWEKMLTGCIQEDLCGM